VALVAAAFLLISFQTADATVIDFNGITAGTVVAGQDPSGTTVPGASFGEFTLSCINNGGGPSSIVVFDSQAPTGGDVDLGTPHEDFGGPGVGSGGETGQPGANDRSWGHLLVIAENIVDDDGDGLVDTPDDEGGGGVFVFDFEQAVNIQRVVLVDIDSDETAVVRLYNSVGLLSTLSAQSLGNNSVQTLMGEEYSGVHRMEIELSSSGAVGEIEYVFDTTPVAQTSWGGIKAMYID
jgi:hypothetical protein